jgi:hypothetical protein
VRLLAALVLPALLTLGVAYGGSRFVGGPVHSPLRAEGFVWGKRTFPNRAAFARWYEARGRSYAVWVSRHPTQPPAKAAKKSRSSGVRLSPTVSAAAYAGVIFLAVVGIGLRIKRRRRWRRRHLLARSRLAFARAHSVSVATWHEHPDLAWYVAGTVLVTGAVVVIGSWT